MPERQERGPGRRGPLPEKIFPVFWGEKDKNSAKRRAFCARDDIVQAAAFMRSVYKFHVRSRFPAKDFRICFHFGAAFFGSCRKAVLFLLQKKSYDGSEAFPVLPSLPLASVSPPSESLFSTPLTA